MAPSLLRKFSKRRRPKARRAQLVSGLLAEDECYSIRDEDLTFASPYSATYNNSSATYNNKTHSSKGARPVGLMQRFSNWIGEHLAGRGKRRERRDSSAAADARRAEIIVGGGGAAMTMGSERKAPPRAIADELYANHSNTYRRQQPAYELKRRAICTNPWILPPPESSRSMISTSLSRNTDLLDASYSSSLCQLTRDESLRINTLAGSACSSGYGSNDSSPECSVHQPSWQPSTQIQNRGNLVDKAVDCHSLDLDEELGIMPIDEDYDHIYYELELKPRGHHPNNTKKSAAEDSCYSGSVELNTQQMGVGASNTASSTTSSRSDSPIYAIPCTSSAGESPCGSIDYADDSDGYAELARRYDDLMAAERSTTTREHATTAESSGHYARLRKVPSNSMNTKPQMSSRLPPPQFHAPPPPPLASATSEFPRNCLDLLDEQIAELKHKTEMVSRLVETAKEKRELRDLARSLCLEHIQNLRSMRLFVESGFELHI